MSLRNRELLNLIAVGLWLLVCAAMIFVMVLLGGITRLSGSGLSIMEWKPLMGALPPMSTAAGPPCRTVSNAPSRTAISAARPTRTGLVPRLLIS